jgi:hypothetical protein
MRRFHPGKLLGQLDVAGGTATLNNSQIDRAMIVSYGGRRAVYWRIQDKS